jgi:sialate O-acetylesterase
MIKQMKCAMFAAALLLAFSVNAQLRLSPLFSNNMVLQQQSETPVWGESKPNQKVTIIPSWNNKEYIVTANEQGLWKTAIATPVAGGPYSITVSTSKKDKIFIQNVLIGEVWLCSGQSNMEMRVRESGNFENEQAGADFPQIRMLTVEKTTSIHPSSQLNAKEAWQICTPATVGEFSAAAYFFGRNIHQSRQVPVGLINTSWGGTLAEAWTSAESLSQMPYFETSVAAIRELPESRDEQDKIFKQQWDKWLSELNQLDPVFQKKANLWQPFTVPGLVQEQKISLQNGIFWFRKEIDIPADWAGQPLTLSLGVVDDDDFTYFNGVAIGNMEGWMSRRNYTVPASLVKAGKATISVRVLDTGGLGGFLGEKTDYYVQSSKGKIALAGAWEVQLALSLTDFPAVPKRINGEPNHPSVLYNAMIYPIVPYKIKGAIWYQGEANTGRAIQYRELLPLMITDWRKSFGSDFPFYIVQLANYTALQTEPVESTWAELREAQYLTTHLDNTGIATIIDIGEANDIHPKNKQDVGNRLAFAARAKTYNEKIPYSGPVYDSYRIIDHQIRIKFQHTEGGLKTANNEVLQGFTIAGLDHRFRWAEAVIDGNEIVVSHPDIAFPVAVRYAWADNPICNLYNGTGLPAVPFRTDTWIGITQ